MADIQLYAGERLLKVQEGGVKEPGKALYYNGKIFLTNQRFVSHKRSIWIQVLFGFLIANAFKGKFHFDIPLTSLKSISRKSIMGTFSLETTDGRIYTISAPFKAWQPAIRDALATYHRLQLVDSGNDRWVVQQANVVAQG